ncbi:MAG TPA: NAD(+) synthase [Isosphaeraceae bacterium]|jgi:NAD+ synthase (glutamine-hydrolysing)|nr:NAD(+) synthase [Isosphaeraceae bacterium]
MAAEKAHLAVASVNQTVGDWRGNDRRIREVVAEARGAGVRLLLLPEMCIPGYSLGDRLLRMGTIERSWAGLVNLADATRGIAVAVGLPILFEGVVYNAMGLLADGALVGLVAKANLATGDVEYENRYFQAWPHGRRVDYRGPDGLAAPLGTQMFELPGLGTIGFEICEDAWKGIRPGSTYALAGAEILLNPSASWFTIGKHRVRRRMVEQISREDHCVYMYASLLGCDATRLIFDGSLFLAVNGRVEAEGRRFVFGRDWELLQRVVDLNEVHVARMEEGSWREQLSRVQAGTFGQPPPVVRVAGDYATAAEAPPPPPYWVPPEPSHPDPSLQYLENLALGGRPIAERDLNHLELELALALALRDYLGKTGVRNCCLALSGGRDSAMVAFLVHRMYRYQFPEMPRDELAASIADRFLCAYLATENSSQTTRDAARAVAREAGATFLDGSVQGALDAAEEAVGRLTGTPLSWEDPRHDLPLQNIQARVRGMLIWTIANMHNALLLVTSNKSEAAVGYTTMDGDTSGGLAPIADVPKSLVKLYLAWARQFHGAEGLGRVDAMEASAELRPPGREQTDESDLMPFPVLDQLMNAFVQLGLDPLAILKRLWPNVRPYYPDGPARFAADIRKFVRMFCFAQWKRERFAISFRVTSFDLDPKTGFRFPPVQAPFTEELEELDRYLAGLE